MTLDPITPLPAGVLTADIDRLHLDRQSRERLRAVGISTIGELAGARYVSQKGWDALGGDAGKSASAVLMLLRDHCEGDVVDWPGFWQARSVSVVPAVVPTGSPNIATLMAALPQIVQAALADTTWKRADPERDWVVIDGRKGLVSSPKTLEELGSGALGLTRERVRQLEVDAMGRLRRAWAERFHGTTYRLRSELDAAVARLADTAPVVGAPTFEDDLLATLGLGPRMTDRDTRRLAFLLELAGRVRFNADGKRRPAVWADGNDAGAGTRVELADRVGRLLTESHVEPMSETDIVVDLNRGRRSRLVPLEAVQGAMRLCRFAERLEDGRWQGRFECLVGRGNQVFRVIADAGRPLHLDLVAREINSRMSGAPVGVRNLANQLSVDGRFVPIGKSGEWGLKAEHGADSATIVEMMVEALRRANTPLPASAIQAAVEARRPVAKASVNIYLDTRPEFTKLRDGTWARSDWPEARTMREVVVPKKPRVRRGPSLSDRIAAVLFPYLAGVPGREGELADVVNHLASSLGNSPYTFYQYLDGRIPGVARVDVDGAKLVRLRRPPGLAEDLDLSAARQIVAAGEGTRVQFRPTLRWDLTERFDNPTLQKLCTEAIAAFANSEGGVLVVGVQPDGSVVGVEPDCECIQRGRDSCVDVFSQAFVSVVAEHLGAAALAVMATSFATIAEHSVCFIRVARSPKPIHLLDGKVVEFYVRRASTSQLLGTAEADKYIKSHWS